MVIESSQLLGHALGACTLQSLLGRGGMGAVYLAQQSRPRRVVAVKVLMPGLLLETKVRAEFLVRFRREADAIAALDHINIMPIYEYGEQEELAYLVMPYITGGTLRDVLEKRAMLPLCEILPIIEQATAALDYAHAQGIIHRDLKPGNMLFHADGRVILADFGLAKIVQQSAGQQEVPGVTSVGAVIGTPEYFSPEQSTGNPVDKRTDVYSLGIVLYQMLSGRVPFTGPTAVAIAVKHAVEEPPSLSQVNPTLSHGLEAVVMKAIAKRPEQRYASAGEFARALRAAVPSALLSQPLSPGSAEITARMNPVTLMSNDTILATPDAPFHEAETVKTPSLPPRTSGWEQTFGSSSSPIKDRVGDKSGCRSPWLALIAGILAVLLVIGGAAAYLRLIPGGSATQTASTSKPTSTPTEKAAPKLPVALIPAGALLYGTTLPACDAQRGLWSESVNARVICDATVAQLENVNRTYLAGAFLDTLPNGYGIPDDYILQVQVNAGPGSQSGFGVFFRNQPGLIHQGAFSFLLYPQGRWEASVYNDITGRQTLLHRDQASVSLDGTMTIDVIVHGSSFTFYLNGKYQGRASSMLYPSGTIGLAAGAGAEVFFKNLAIYTLPAS